MAQMKPVINIYYWKVEEACKREVAAGIEEEGVLSLLSERTITDPLGSAYDAAMNSLLGVGIALTEREGVLHMQDLELGKPLLHIETNDLDQLRELGSNAARYIKGLPFRGYENKGRDERNW